MNHNFETRENGNFKKTDSFFIILQVLRGSRFLMLSVQYKSNNRINVLYNETFWLIDNIRFENGIEYRANVN